MEHPALAGAGVGTSGPAACSRSLWAWRPVQPAALWKLEVVPLLPSPYPGRAVPPSRAAEQGRAQLWRRCDTHSFNCTYTKEWEAVGLLGEGSRGCC